MNWKAFAFIFAAPFVAALNNVLVSNVSGVHVPITAGTVLVPAAAVAMKSLIALYTQSPVAQK